MTRPLTSDDVLTIVEKVRERVKGRLESAEDRVLRASTDEWREEHERDAQFYENILHVLWDIGMVVGNESDPWNSETITFPVTATEHAGGFVEHGEDGPKAIQIGFATSDGHLVSVTRDAFNAAIRWIDEKEIEAAND